MKLALTWNTALMEEDSGVIVACLSMQRVIHISAQRLVNNIGSGFMLIIREAGLRIVILYP